jgi:DNA modification methylase
MAAKALSIEQRDPNKLRAHKGNYRKHPVPQLQQLRDSLQEHGFQKPIVIQPDGTILAGHGLVEAAKAAEMKAVPVHVYDGPNPEKYLIADNETVRGSEDDQQALLALLNAQESLEGTGWDTEAKDELAALLKAQEPDVREDPGPVEVEGPVYSVRGEVYQLGRHRVMCGDSGDIDAMDALMNGALAQVVFTDPPYGIGYCSWSMLEDGGDAIEGDGRDQDIAQLYRDQAASWLAITGDAAVAYIFYSLSRPESRQAIEDAGWKVKDTIAWVKPSFAPGRNDYQNQWESLLYAARGGVSRHWCGRRDLSNVWQFDRDLGVEHPTNKPVELVAHAIGNSSGNGDVVYDPFGGSGSTLIACERTKRVARLCEIEPRYVDVIRRRYAQFVGDESLLPENAGPVS